jgi:carbon-monoxide dehydrogenase catalytic subunit
LYEAKPEGPYKVKDADKLLRIAKEWGVETEGKDIYDVAHEVAYIAMEEYGKVFGSEMGSTCSETYPGTVGEG